jgi:hypothetical protein
MNCERLEEVIFAGPIWNIRSSAFTGCKMLQRIVLAEGLLNIGKYAFSWCTNLKQITFPETLLRIGEYAFSYCRNLEDANFPEDSVCIQHESAFYECKIPCVEKLFGELTPDEKKFCEDHCSISGEDFEAITPIILLRCGHFFKRGSLLDWLKIKKVCPMCRRKIGF